ncbi:hypothetical protein CgunFtcFv8_001502 [Champsocephalus gunnari]|uniref:Uncharacterized protein n=1 Tax=Champsocephalus gunnari TaxID=52237 RepID=A0AAN8CKP4_CHAGU|nr:hypothetical protein CgunFtcFv8_001502 [Champsocephalus gunnari]
MTYCPVLIAVYFYTVSHSVDMCAACVDSAARDQILERLFGNVLFPVEMVSALIRLPVEIPQHRIRGAPGKKCGTMLEGYSPVTQALLGTLFTWGLTAAGAALVFIFSSRQKRILDGSLGFAAGVMLAASYWSLLAPAIGMAEDSGKYGSFAFVPVAVGVHARSGVRLLR